MLKGDLWALIAFSLCASAAILGILIRRREKEDIRPRLRHDKWIELLGACYSNAAQAERLVQYEQKLAPGISRETAADRALSKLLRDRD
jgi:hypothetical protein